MKYVILLALCICALTPSFAEAGSNASNILFEDALALPPPAPPPAMHLPNLDFLWRDWAIPFFQPDPVPPPIPFLPGHKQPMWRR